MSDVIAAIDQFEDVPSVKNIAGLWNTLQLCKDRITDLERRNGELEKALESVADPIVHMQQEAEREGQRLDGMMAVILSEDPEYLKGIARAALTRTKEQK